MIVEIVKATLEEAMKVVAEAVEKGYKFVTATEIAGLHYVKLDASDVVKEVESEVDAKSVAQEPQKPAEAVEAVAAEPQQAVEVEVIKPSAKRGKK